MRVINVRNVHDALPRGVELLTLEGVREETRNGPALVAPWPVCTVYERPTERVLFWSARDANPFFHFFEALWMLAGRNDVGFPASFAKQIEQYSDDGLTLNGAYGHRWRYHFERDQLLDAIIEFRRDPNSRRVVIQMWDAQWDLGRISKDLPCNTQLFLRLNHGVLDMTILNRSNDMVWGAYGANAVHFSFLQEYIATAVGVPVGRMYQFSNNFHAYLNTFTKVEGLSSAAPDSFRTVHNNPYLLGEVRPEPLGFTEVSQFDRELRSYMACPTSESGIAEPFLFAVAWPLFKAHECYKQKDFAQAKSWVTLSTATDWRKACLEWLTRRELAHLEKRSSS